MSFQYLTFFILQNTKEDVLKW